MGNIQILFSYLDSFEDISTLITGLVKYLRIGKNKLVKSSSCNEVKMNQFNTYKKTMILGLKLLQKYILQDTLDLESRKISNDEKLSLKQNIMLEHNVDSLLIQMILIRDDKKILNEVFQ